jgi:hypothetical protein
MSGLTKGCLHIKILKEYAGSSPAELTKLKTLVRSSFASKYSPLLCRGIAP